MTGLAGAGLREGQYSARQYFPAPGKSSGKFTVSPAGYCHPDVTPKKEVACQVRQGVRIYVPLMQHG